MEEAEVRQKGKLRHSHAGEYRFSSKHNGRPLEGFNRVTLTRLAYLWTQQRHKQQPQAEAGR